MDTALAGIHHVTALAGDPQANVDFYTGVLGLRLVKKTVNFDDPGTYHLYYGDEVGRPGTLLTFFPWPLARRGQLGAGQATTTSFAVPAGSLGYWSERLRRHGAATGEPGPRGEDEDVLRVADPDGLELELVASAGIAEHQPWAGGPIPAEHAIRGLFGVTLTEWNADRTVEMLTGTLGFRLHSQAGERIRLVVGEGGAAGSRLDLLAQPAAARGRISRGTVHHVAWRVAGAAEQRDWQRKLSEGGLQVTPIMDRQYFHSIYFSEPGGVLFEIATDPPGFATDESVAELGSGLKLPPWLESSRAEIESVLPPLAPARTADLPPTVAESRRS